jgi:hypothetical protein
MLLDDEQERALSPGAAERLGRCLRVAFLTVGVELRHNFYSARSHDVDTRLKTLWMVWRKSR